MGYLRKLFHFMQYDDPAYNSAYDDFMYLEQGEPYNTNAQFLM